MICVLCIGISTAYARDPIRVSALRQRITEAKSKGNLYLVLEESADLHCSCNKNEYNEFVAFLNSLSGEDKELQPQADYFAALCRYRQLKCLEETQNWDEYFANGNTYRDEIVYAAQKAADNTGPHDKINLYAKMLLWRFHKDQQDVFAQDALSVLMASALEYAKNTPDLSAVKETADILAAYAEKGKSRELYSIYLNKLLSSGIEHSGLAKTAEGFYKEGNLDLAELVYGAYIEKITAALPKEQLLCVLFGLAEKFSYSDTAPCSPLYAEKIFQKIEEAGGKNAFDEKQLYLRAFNLEKAKLYPEAKDVYLELLSRFPSSAHFDKVSFKVGIIYAYVLGDLNNAYAYFDGLAAKNASGPQIISALYQLGLLNQWQDNNAKAKECYFKLIEKAQGGYADIAALARERLKEIEEAKPIDYNLKAFLDISLQEERPAYDMSKLELNAMPRIADKNQPVSVKASPYTAESGCMPIALQYLWSGDLGAAKPDSSQAFFSAQYSFAGTYVIALVVTSPAGIIDRGIEIIDIQ